MPDMQIPKGHSFVSESRNSIKLLGVSDVVSFDDREVVLQTVCGGMTIEGEELHVGVLNVEEGRIEIDGRIDGLFYFDNTPTQKKKMFGKK